jgi:anti-sigma factor RsiW
MSPSRDELELRLPFHVNGTLSEDEAREVEAWLAQDDAARAEAEGLAAIRAGMQAEDVRSPGEFGFARLMREVGREAAAPVPASGVSSVAAPAAANSARRPWLWQAVAAVAVAALVGQVLIDRPGAPGAGFELAGAPPAAEVAGPALVVAFAPGATEAEIRALLLDAGSEIVAGPSALGLYRLASDDPEAALAVLRGATIIESVTTEAE